MPRDASSERRAVREDVGYLQGCIDVAFGEGITGGET